MAQTETRPLVVYDAKDGGVTTNKSNIKWICSNNAQRPLLQILRKNVEDKGEYKYSKVIKSSDIKITSESLRFNPVCGGDFFNTIDRLTNRYDLKYNRKFKHLCCMGKLNSTSTQKFCDPKWKFESEECDETARKYCADNPKDPKCGCMLSAEEYKESKLIGPPECIDSRCAGDPKAYKTQAMLKRNCPNIVNCVIDKTTIENIESSTIGGVQYEQNCGISLEEAKKIAKLKSQENGSTTLIGNPLTLSLGIGGLVLISIGGYLLYKNNNENYSDI